MGRPEPELRAPRRMARGNSPRRGDRVTQTSSPNQGRCKMKRRTTRPAFVTTLAVMMIALVAVALAALTTRIGTAARQSTAAREQAQVEQLVLAGLQIAAQQTADVDKDIPLPKELAEAGAKLKITTRAKHIAIEAQYGRARMTI